MQLKKSKNKFIILTIQISPTFCTLNYLDTNFKKVKELEFYNHTTKIITPFVISQMLPLILRACVCYATHSLFYQFGKKLICLNRMHDNDFNTSSK